MVDTQTETKEKKPIDWKEYYTEQARKAREARAKKAIKRKLSEPERKQREAEKLEKKRREREYELGVTRPELLKLEKHEAEYKRHKTKKKYRKERAEMHPSIRKSYGKRLKRSLNVPKSKLSRLSRAFKLF